MNRTGKVVGHRQGLGQSVVELGSVDEARLAAYCSPTTNYAWPAYDVDLAPDRLLPTDLLAPALLSYPIPTRILQELAGDRPSVYRRLRGALEDVIADEESARVSFASLSAEQLENRSLPGWGTVLRALDAVQDCPGLTSVAVTKILHRKRPDLVPIVDSRLRAFYGVERSGYPALFERMHRDLVANLGRLDKLRGPYQLENGHQMSLLRALDIIVWMGGE